MPDVGPIIRTLGLVGSFILLPLAFLRHVSELYVYTAMPPIALLFGYGVSNFFTIFRNERITRLGILVFSVLLFGSHGYAVHTKAGLCIANGQRATILIQEIGPYVAQVPPGGALILLNPKTSAIEYSVFLLEGFNVLHYGETILRQIGHRNDIQVRIANEHETRSFVPPVGSLVLTLGKTGQVVLWKPR